MAILPPTPAKFCQPNAAAAATCSAQAGLPGCSVCGSGTCNVDPYGGGASTTVWDWLNQVNGANFAGHNDWRLPSEEGHNTGSATPRELETILLAPYVCGTSPCIDSIFGPTVAYFYWSATEHWSGVRGVYFDDGLEYGSLTAFSNYVRAVRSGP